MTLSQTCSLLLGLCVALTVFVFGTGREQRQQAPSSVTVQSKGLPDGLARVAEPIQAYYLVDSEDDELVTRLETAYAKPPGSEPAPSRRVRILMARNDAEEAIALTCFEDETRDASGVIVTFVDVRRRTVMDTQP